MPRDTLEITEETKTQEAQKMPDFQKKWWHTPKRLDGRPIMWSLRNHPEEWTWTYRYYSLNQITHIPSRHIFNVGWQFGLWGLYRASCSCTNTSRKFQFFQNWGLTMAFKNWLKNYGQEKFVDPKIAQLREERIARVKDERLERERQRLQFINHFNGKKLPE